jgi:hypothetical protein
MDRRPLRVCSHWMAVLALALCFSPASPAQTTSPQTGLSRRARLHRNLASASSPSIPLTAGKWSQISELNPTTAPPLIDSGALFGSGVALSGNTALVSYQVTSTQPSGASAFIFQKPASGWKNMVAQATLFTPGEFLGVAGTALSGNTAVICETDAAYVFVKAATGWTDMEPTATLTTTDGAGCSIVYGTLSISSDGNTIVFGDFESDSGTGAAYVFVKPATGWADMTQTAKLTASDAQASSLFGYCTFISGDTVMVGSPGAGVQDTGKIYVYVEPPSGWADMTETAQLTVPNAPQKAEVGTGLSLDGDTLLASSFAETAYIFTKPAGGWTNATPSVSLTAADGPSSDLGIAVSLSGKIAAVAASNRGGTQSAQAGGVYIFNEPKGGWKTMASNVLLTPSDCHYFCDFGSSVWLQGNLLLVGADYAQNTAGAAYIFELP